MENFINSIKKSTECINENKYFIGIAMILLNIGARFIIDELDDDLRKMISNKFIRRLFIFCSFFMATRDLFTAVILTIIFIILINEVFGKELNNMDKKDEKGGASFNKNEIEKTINQLKTIQMNM